jgi:hypothetical protein
MRDRQHAPMPVAPDRTTPLDYVRPIPEVKRTHPTWMIVVAWVTAISLLGFGCFIAVLMLLKKLRMI